jgi:hypothetical protein
MLSRSLLEVVSRLHRSSICEGGGRDKPSSRSNEKGSPANPPIFDLPNMARLARLDAEESGGSKHDPWTRHAT